MATLDDDKIIVVVKKNYSGNIMQNLRVYDYKYIKKESNVCYTTQSERSLLREL